jgi:hypothetical protein
MPRHPVCRDRLVCRVVRHQPGVAVDPLQRLHRGLIGRGPVKLGSHDFAVLRRLLPPDHYQVAVDDRRPGHRVPLDLEHEHVPVTDQPPRRQEAVLSQFHRVHGDAGCDLPDERDLDLITLSPGCGTGGLHDRTWLSGPAVQGPIPHQH